MESGKMVKARKITWVSWIFLTVLFFGVPSFIHADISDILLKFHPYLVAEETYSTNILLSPNRFKLADYITTVNPGLRFTHVQAGSYGIDLDVSGGYTYYKKNAEFSYWDYQGRLDSWYAVTPKLTFRLRDYVIRSDAGREDQYDSSYLYNDQGQYIGDTQAGQYLLSTERVHAVYTRNVVEPSVEYRFGRENLARLLYRNNIYRNKNPLFEDSTENTISPLLNYWLDIKNGITLEYILTLGHFERSEDLTGHEIRGRYTHRLNPRLSLFGEYIYTKEDFAYPGVDYDVHNPSLGLEYKFSPTLTGTLQGGYFWESADDDSRSRGPFFHVGLIQTGQKTNYALMFDAGYSRDYFTAENLGFEKYYRGYGTITHRLTQRLSLQANGSGYRMWYPQSEDNRKDWIWDGRLSASYALFQWLTLTLEGGHQETHSNIEGLSYSEYSGTLRITLGQMGYQPGLGIGRAYR